ncbi:effector protein Tle3 domain-containing protein, partial [Pseudomonas protegens]|uniref:effector protein Tle3 domain-containing protein n=2 Tax=Pseudomonas protegens TaxID=380021 RepID=UPI003D0FE124
PYVYPLLLKGEDTWEDAGLPYKQRMSVARASLEQGKSVMLTAPLLPVPVATNFDADGTVVMPGADSNSGVYQVKDKLAPIDAAIAVSNKAWSPESAKHTRLESIDETVAFKHGRDIGSVQEALNEGKEISEITHVFAARATDSGKVLVTRSETPYEARLRLQSGGKNKERKRCLFTRPFQTTRSIAGECWRMTWR